MATTEQLNEFRNIISSRPEEERSNFVNKFKSLPDYKKDIAIQRTIQGFNPQQEQPVVVEPNSAFPQTGDPTIDFLLRAKEVVSPIARGANVAAFGLPQLALSKFDDKLAQEAFEAPKTGAGQVADVGAQIAGLVGGGAAKLGVGAGKLAAKQLLGKSAAAGIGARALEGGISGAVSGASQIFDPDTDIKQQAMQAAGGAVFGAAVGSVIGGVEKASRFVKKQFFSPVAKKRSINKRISEASKGATATAKEKVDKLRILASEDISNRTAAMKSNLQTLTDDLGKESFQTASKVQSHIKQFSRANSKAYGQVIDDISDSLSKSDKNISRERISGVFDETLDELSEMDITEGSPLSMIKSLSKKYQLVDDDVIESAILDPTGKAISKVRVVDGGQPVPFKNIVEDIKKLNKSLSAQAKGIGRFGADDIAVSVYRKNMGKLLDEVSEGQFGSLQSDYGKNVEVIKKAYTMFKPAKGETALSQAERFFKRRGLGKTGEAEEKFVKFLEGGTKTGGKNVAGLGDITAGVQRSGVRVQQATKKIKDIKTQLVADRNKVEAVINARKNSRLESLERRKRRVEDMQAARKRINTIRGGAAGVGTVVGSGLLLKSLLTGGR